MGTISEKLTYLNGTKQLLKDKINNLGGEITDNTTFRNYANQLQNVYDNLPKTEYQEGTEINLGKTIKGKLDYDNGVVGIGQNEQDSTQGYNLLTLQNLIISSLKLNITQSINNSILSLNGTANADGQLINAQPLGITLSAGTYTFSVYSEGSFTRNGKDIGFYIRNSTSSLCSVTTYYIERNENSVALTLSEETALYIQVYCNGSGIVFNNCKFKLQITSGNTAKSFEQYTGGQASPNPSYPQTINSVTGTQNVVVKDGDNNTIVTYQLSLGDIELNAIGNYKDELVYDIDEDKVYKNKAINKVSLKTLDWETASVGTNSYGTRILMSSIGKVVTDINIICSHATGIMFNDRNTYSGTSIYDETNGYVVFRNTAFTSLEYFTTFLNNNNVYAYYVLATPTLTEITDTTLKDQVKALYNAHSLNGTTIITSNGNLPMIIKVRGLKGE